VFGDEQFSHLLQPVGPGDAWLVAATCGRHRWRRPREQQL